MEKNKKKKAINKEDEALKLEIAAELGLLEKVKQFGWKGLTAKETGKIGGVMTKYKKQMQQKSQQA
jgi:small acid-soluble spore protein F (minor alpha/beta-type SASP)